MKIKHWLLIIFIITLISCPITVHADTGPKPSVVINFNGLEDENYYVTLLSERDSTGPWSHGNSYYEYMGDKAVFNKFYEYEDSDGYYYLSFMQDCSHDNRFEWTYYPPNKFKLLIYYPDYDVFQVSDDIYERYAFDSYFVVNIDKTEGIDSDSTLVLEKNYNYTKEIFSLVIRIIITIFIEIAIAFVFGYRHKKNLQIITITNIFTQVLLNVFLYFVQYINGFYSFIFCYVLLEIVVILIEGYIYKRHTSLVDPVSDRKMHPIFYAITANGASLLIGIWLANIIPSIF